MQRSSYAVLSDSGSLDEEASVLNFPALSLRNSRERNDTSDAGGAIMTGVEWSRVADALKLIRRRIDVGFYDKRVNRSTERNVSEKVAQIILGYAPYVDSFVWHKNSDFDARSGKL